MAKTKVDDTFMYKGKHEDSYFYFYDIDGNETNEATKIVAKEVQKDEGSSYFVRVEGLTPVHHEKFKGSVVINPNFVKVNKEIFENYVNYLLSKKEGLYKLTTQMMKAKGLV